MMARNLKLVITYLALFFFSFNATASDLSKGITAVEEDRITDAFKILKPLADRGDIDAAFHLAQAIDKTIVLRSMGDGSEAYHYFLKKLNLLEMAAFGGHEQAALQLALIHLGQSSVKNKLVPRDVTRAKFWLKKLSESGNQQAKNWLDSVSEASALAGDYSCSSSQHTELKPDGSIQKFYPVKFKFSWILPKNMDREVVWIHENEQLMMGGTLHEIEYLPADKYNLDAVSFKLYRPADENQRNNNPEINAGGVFKKGLLYLNYTSSFEFIKSTTVVIADCHKL